MNATREALLDTAAADTRALLLSAVDTLASVRALTSIEVRNLDRAALHDAVLDPLVDYNEVALAALYLVSADGAWNCATYRTWNGGFPATPEQLFATTAVTATAAGMPIESITTPAHCASSLLLPVSARGNCAAVLALHHPRAHWFDEWRTHALELFAAVLGHVLENARHLQHMESMVDQRTGQLEAALREAEQLKRRYEQLSNLDELTGLPNRRFFFPAVESVLARALRYTHPFSLMLMDIDHFKRINDLLGHAAGDEVLRAVATAVAGELREGDIVARFGGEEFVVALPNTGTEGALPLAQRVLDRVAATRWDGPDGPVAVTLSIGITNLDQRTGADSRSLLDCLIGEADLAMYFGKRNGRNQVNAHAALPADAPREHLD